MMQILKRAKIMDEIVNLSNRITQKTKNIIKDQYG